MLILGWNAPIASTVLVHPEGYTANASTGKLDISFTPNPAYAEIALAAGGAWAKRVVNPNELDDAILSAVSVVKSGTCAVLEVV